MSEQQPTPHFSRVAPGVDLPELDSRVLALWDRVDAFRSSIEMRTPESEYTFYDGPPFATGSPHYGHILQGVVKDIVPRYWTMRGHRVERRFGWDTHGLPVEMEVQKLLGVSGPREIEELKALGGPHHKILGPLGIMPAKNTAVNVMISAWRRSTKPRAN